MKTEQVIRLIEDAFHEVRLGEGIGLWEAQAIDDYCTKAVQREQRARDEKEEWRRLEADTLQRCHSSLSFFDADGMRFHLPAYMIATLRREPVDDPVFHLVGFDDYALSRFTTLNVSQKRAIAAFLEWCAEQEDYDFERPNIRRALKDTWRA